METRRIWTSDILNEYVDFPHVGQVFWIERIVENLSTGKIRSEMVYGLTSCSQAKASPEFVLAAVRGHWSIENRLHWVRDVTFDEDRCRIRKGNGAQTMASLRNLAISVLRLAGATSISSALRRCARIGSKVLRFLGLTP